MSYRNWVLICLWSNVVKVVIFQPKAILLVYSTLNCEFGWPKVTFQGFLNYEKRQGGIRLSKISFSNLWNIFVSLQKLWTLPWRTKIIRFQKDLRKEEIKQNKYSVFSLPPSNIWFGDFITISVLPKPETRLFFLSQQFTCPQKCQHAKSIHEVQSQF